MNNDRDGLDGSSGPHSGPALPPCCPCRPPSRTPLGNGQSSLDTRVSYLLIWSLEPSLILEPSLQSRVKQSMSSLSCFLHHHPLTHDFLSTFRLRLGCLPTWLPLAPTSLSPSMIAPLLSFSHLTISFQLSVYTRPSSHCSPHNPRHRRIRSGSSVLLRRHKMLVQGSQPSFPYPTSTY